MPNQNRKIKCDLWMKTKYMVASWRASERWIALNRFKFGRALCLVPSKPLLHNVPSKPSLPTCEPCALHGALCDTSCPIPLPSPFLSSTLLGQSYYCWSLIWWNKVKSGIVFVASHLLRRAKHLLQHIPFAQWITAWMYVQIERYIFFKMNRFYWRPHVKMFDFFQTISRKGVACSGKSSLLWRR